MFTELFTSLYKVSGRADSTNNLIRAVNKFGISPGFGAFPLAVGRQKFQ
jgi:hypothetical protein